MRISGKSAVFSIAGAPSAASGAIMDSEPRQLSLRPDRQTQARSAYEYPICPCLFLSVSSFLLAKVFAAERDRKPACSSPARRDSSPHASGLGFLQPPPHDDAPALLLTFGSAHTWYRDCHPTSSVPCPANMVEFSRIAKRAGAPSATTL
jgi:hypothetical protein